MDALTNGVTIVADDGTSYHSFTDFGLAIGNNNYIEAPEYDTYYVEVPGRDGLLDLTEMITGRPTYRTREINIELGGMGDPNTWDAKISQLRNLFHGHVVKLIFDNDPTYYWTGRAEIIDYDRFRNLGTFTLAIPQADPFKYALTIQPDLSELSCSTTQRSVSLPVTGMPVDPTFVISGMTEGGTSSSTTANLYIYDGSTLIWSKTLIKKNGTYRPLGLWLSKTVTLRYSATSSTKLSIIYRQASL